MTVIRILAVIAVIVIIWWILAKMQDYSAKKYNFPLFNLVTFAILIVGWLSFFLAIYVLPDENLMSDVWSAIVALTFPEPISNSIALVLIALAIFASMLILITVRTNLLFGPVAWFFQIIASALIVPFLIFLIPGGKKRRRPYRRRRTY